MLQLNNGFYVAADSSGYALHQIRRPDRSEAIQKALEANEITTLNKYSDVIIGYFGSLSDALGGYAKARIRLHVKDAATDLSQVRTLLKNLHEEISKVNV